MAKVKPFVFNSYKITQDLLDTFTEGERGLDISERTKIPVLRYHASVPKSAAYCENEMLLHYHTNSFAIFFKELQIATRFTFTQKHDEPVMVMQLTCKDAFMTADHKILMSPAANKTETIEIEDNILERALTEETSKQLLEKVLEIFLEHVILPYNSRENFSSLTHTVEVFPVHYA